MSFSTPIIRRMLERSEGAMEGGTRDLYVITDGSITCGLCGHKSEDAKDVSNRFCPNCKTFFDDLKYMVRLNQALRRRFEPRDADWERLKAA